jgi:hypothetical protein
VQDDDVPMVTSSRALSASELSSFSVFTEQLEEYVSLSLADASDDAVDTSLLILLEECVSLLDASDDAVDTSLLLLVEELVSLLDADASDDAVFTSLLMLLEEYVSLSIACRSASCSLSISALCCCVI